MVAVNAAGSTYEIDELIPTAYQVVRSGDDATFNTTWRDGEDGYRLLDTNNGVIYESGGE